jgi:hypothetical protein
MVVVVVAAARNGSVRYGETHPDIDLGQWYILVTA